MRPYLAIIVDSFRAALATRVLYVLLGMITILLLALAPLRTVEVLDWKVQIGQHVRNPDSLIRRLITKKDDLDRPYVARIWNQLPSALQKKMERLTGKDDPDQNESMFTGMELVEELNQVIHSTDFYHEEDWKGKRVGAEAEQLIEAGPTTLSPERMRRLNRLLVGRALSPDLRKGSATALDIYYANWRLDWFSTSQTRQQFASAIASSIPKIFDKFVLSIGLFIAILVTSNLIPETIDPGSLNLLLSKPVSRWALYVAKFMGGCAFITLCVGYLFVGIWIWLGVRLEIWDRGFLLSIPLYVLVFAIYFSVSALVGLLYRSAILAIVMTGVFWAFCYVVGMSYGFLDTRHENLKLTTIAPCGDHQLAVTSIGKVVAWDDRKQAWEPQAEVELKQEEEMAMNFMIYMGEVQDEPMRLPPLLDQSSQLMVLGVSPLLDLSSRDHQMVFVSAKEKLDFVEIGKFPRRTMRMFSSKRGLIVVSSSGKFLRLPADELRSFDPASKTEPSKGKLKNDMFESAGPDKPVVIGSSSNVAFHSDSEQIVIYHQGSLTIYGPNEEGTYAQQHEVDLELDLDSSMSCQIAYAGNAILVVLGNGQVIVLDAKTFERQEYLPESRYAIDQVRSSQDGRWFALLYRNKVAWVLDTNDKQGLRKAPVRGQGDISAIEFDDQNRMWVVDRTDRATYYDLLDEKMGEVYSPDGNWLDTTYRYFLGPVYKVCPKPGEFYKVVTHLSQTSDTRNRRNVDLTLSKKPANPWLPLTSGLGFMAVMLAISCAIFHFRDY